MFVCVHVHFISRASLQTDISPLSTRASSIPSLYEVVDADNRPELLPRQSGKQADRHISDPSSEELGEVPMETDQEESEQFCVADVRKRLRDHLHAPKKMFGRDPDDPSG